MTGSRDHWASRVIEAEQMVLGSLLVWPDEIEWVADVLKTDAFVEPLHRDIYEAVLHVTAEGITPSAVTIARALEGHPALKDVGGSKYIARLATSVVAATALPDFVRVVWDEWRKRQLDEVAEEIRLRCQMEAAPGDTERLIEDVEDRLHAISGGAQRRRSGYMADESARALLSELEEIAANPGAGIRGVTTGLKDLDRVTGGIRKGHLWIMGGRPGMGKSAIAINFALRAARAGHGVLFASLEMPHQEVTARLLSIIAQSSYRQVPFEDIQKGVLDKEQLARVRDAAAIVDGLPLYIDDQGGRSVASIRLLVRRAKRLMERSGKSLDLLVIDYLQLMRPSADGSRNRNRVQELTEITVGLKALAKEYDIGIVALSQLSRAVEQRDDKRPQLSDLRESGSIEQDADVVLFPYREHYYLSQKKEPSDPEKLEQHIERLSASERLIEMIVAKNRHGRRTSVICDYDPPHGKVTDRVSI